MPREGERHARRALASPGNIRFRTHHPWPAALEEQLPAIRVLGPVKIHACCQNNVQHRLKPYQILAARVSADVQPAFDIRLTKQRLVEVLDKYHLVLLLVVDQLIGDSAD
jgi:hypothetical protein